jgi:hypothetical protein
MTSTTETPAATESRCLRCGRKISTGSYGPKCAAKIREAQRAADLSEWTPRQVEDARELVEDGGVVPTSRERVFRTVSSDGTGVYLTTAKWCGCPAGLKAKNCYHRAAVVIVLGTSAPAPVGAPAPARVTVPSQSIWDELEALGAIGASAPF